MCGDTSWWENKPRTKLFLQRTAEWGWWRDWWHFQSNYTISFSAGGQECRWTPALTQTERKLSHRLRIQMWSTSTWAAHPAVICGCRVQWRRLSGVRGHLGTDWAQCCNFSSSPPEGNTCLHIFFPAEHRQRHRDDGACKKCTCLNFPNGIPPQETELNNS